MIRLHTHYKAPINLNDQVYVRLMPNKPLEPATVIEKCNHPSSFKFILENGKVFERTKRHIYPVT